MSKVQEILHAYETLHSHFTCSIYVTTIQFIRKLLDYICNIFLIEFVFCNIFFRSLKFTDQIIYIYIYIYWLLISFKHISYFITEYIMQRGEGNDAHRKGRDRVPLLVSRDEVV
jgi:hypothetical protein